MANATVKQLNTLAAALPGVIAKLDGELAAAVVTTSTLAAMLSLPLMLSLLH